MPDPILHWTLAIAAAATVAGAARARRSLSNDGAFAALIMGTVIVGLAGWWAGFLLVTFFVSSSLLSHSNKSKRIAAVQARGEERDAVQVVANGGFALLGAVLFGITGHPAWIALLAGSIAAANADTWSTEIGRTSPSRPRMVTTWRSVAAGTSGAVSRRGVAGALGGGALIGILAAIGSHWDLLPAQASWFVALIGISLGGFLGSMLDSLLGATVQDQRWCESCQKGTEQRLHRCGTKTVSIRGIPWIDNDVVNAACAGFGGIVAAIAMSLPG